MGQSMIKAVFFTAILAFSLMIMGSSTVYAQEGSGDTVERGSEGGSERDYEGGSSGGSACVPSDTDEGGGSWNCTTGSGDSGGGVTTSGAITGSLSTCADVRTVTSSGISGGQAGYEASGSVCFTGGSQSFCVNGADYTYTYECAGLTFVAGDADEESAWIDFDPPEDATEEEHVAYHLQTTRDENRGRAGADYPLYMNAFDVCRVIDNTGGAKSMYTGVRTEEEWRSNHGVPAGGNATTEGYTHLGNSSSNPAMEVCCAPQYVLICGEVISTGYAPMGTVVSLASSGGGYAEVICAANNQFAAVSVSGICAGSFSGGYSGGSNDSGPAVNNSYGFENNQTGGRISAQDAVRNGVPDGYEQVSQSVETNAEGAAAQAEMDQDAAEEEAEQQAQDAADEENDDDGNDDGPTL